MNLATRKKHTVIINITSLIDVMFLLLIFFIVSSTFLEQPGLKLDLPSTTVHEAINLEGYTVFILSDGTMYLNDEDINMEKLPRRLEEIAPQVEERGLILKADETVPYGLVINVMDIAKQSGIAKLIVATQPKK